MIGRLADVGKGAYWTIEAHGWQERLEGSPESNSKALKLVTRHQNEIVCSWVLELEGDEKARARTDSPIYFQEYDHSSGCQSQSHSLGISLTDRNQQSFFPMRINLCSCVLTIPSNCPTSGKNQFGTFARAIFERIDENSNCSLNR